MNIQRFTASSSREALAKARMAFGDATLILSNRPTEHGVEVVATTEDALDQLGASPSAPAAKAATAARTTAAQLQSAAASRVEDDAAQLAMSTLSFQDYVRERMLRKRQEAAQPAATARSAAARTPTHHAVTPPHAEPPPEARTPTAPVVRKTVNPVANAMPQGIVDELHAMKELIEDRFNTLTWLGQTRQNPIQANLMLKLIRAGYSPTLARTILERMPEELDAAASVRWVIDVLERNLRTDAGKPSLPEEGGVFDLIGATGVGKTTTTAKLAGLCASTYGAASVGLITLDTYRVGAHEQLRAYGKMLGVVAHLAHD
ncbi:MAG: flagellar biosynthesis protein FlhF, partial [Rhodoferax sp.]